MKRFFVFSLLCLVLGSVELRASEEDFYDERVVDDPHGFWQCSAQPPRLIRVFTVRGEGFRSEIQAQALEKCDEFAVLQCWPLGCKALRR